MATYRTRAEAEAAMRKAKAMFPRGGRGWKHDVWENLGWHFCFLRGPLSVYPDVHDGVTTFHAAMARRVDNSRYGSPEYADDTMQDHKTPQAAAAAVIAAFRARVADDRKRIDDLERFVGPVADEINAAG